MRLCKPNTEGRRANAIGLEDRHSLMPNGMCARSLRPRAARQRLPLARGDGDNLSVQRQPANVGEVVYG